MSDWHSPFWQSLPTCPSIVVQHQRVALSLCCFPIITRSTVFMARKSSVCWQAAECPQVPGDTITYLRRRSVSNILEANRAELYLFYIFCPFSVCVQLMRPCGSVDALVLRVPAVPLFLFKGAFDYIDCAVSWIAAFQNSCNQHVLTKSSSVTANFTEGYGPQ